MISGLASLHIVGQHGDALSEGVSFRTEGVGLCLCRRGKGVVRVDEVRYDVSAGSLGVFFPRSQVQVVERSEDLDVLVMRVDVSAVQPLLNRVGDVGSLLKLREHPLRMVGADDFAMAEGYVEGVLRLQAEESAALREGRAREAQLWGMQGERLRDAVALLVMLLLEARPAADSPQTFSDSPRWEGEANVRGAGEKRRSEVVTTFLGHLHQYFRQEHEVGFYAGLQCLSARYFSWLVRESTGRTPSAWITSFLLEESRWLLSGTSLSVKQIAEQLCFPSQSYFGKWFKQRMGGVGPTSWRRSLISSSSPVKSGEAEGKQEKQT